MCHDFFETGSTTVFLAKIDIENKMHLRRWIWLCNNSQELECFILIIRDLLQIETIWIKKSLTKFSRKEHTKNSWKQRMMQIVINRNTNLSAVSHDFSLLSNRKHDGSKILVCCIYLLSDGNLVPRSFVILNDIVVFCAYTSILQIWRKLAICGL